ncbi:flavoprotein [Opitutaceae bacterium EW11]|nr:flavoprotein [Opitutaceae bacterium EW11]
MILILSASLNSESNSRVLAREAQRLLEKLGESVTLLDLRDFPLPLCDAGPAYSHANVAALNDHIARADAVLVATPIYNFDTNAALKNLIELTGSAWENKVVGFLCAAGGMASYMSVMSFANSLMLDFRSIIVPRFVYATGDGFVDGQVSNPDLRRRVEELARAAARMGRLLAAA